MSRGITVPIDGEKLRVEFDKRKIPLSTASKTLGYEASYISKVIRSNKATKSAMKLIQMTYGIEEDVYVIKEEVSANDNVVEVVQTVGWTDDVKRDLYKIIYSATYEAMRRALSD